MKTTSRVLFLTVVTLGLMASVPTLWAQLVIPSDGSDGDLIVATNTVIDLSQAVTGSWDANNTANKGKGIYDSNKWAVVFKYSSVTISNGATLSFANHASRAPVVWLVKSNVFVHGVITLDGERRTEVPFLSRHAEPGPGGFRGGLSYFAPGVGPSSGFGPGGGGHQGNAGYPGTYGSTAYGNGVTYGNPSLLPLIGGSGAGGDGDTFGDWQVGGPAGGGAILIACAGEVLFEGVLHANGGEGYSGSSREVGGGSGGGVRVIASKLSGGGIIQALGGSGWGGAGGLGRIRVERVVSDNTLRITPDASVVPLEAGSAPLIWPPSSAPSVKIVSVGGVAAPADPRASFGTLGADLTLPEVSSTAVVVETTNVEDASIVTVRLSPRVSGHFTETRAALTQTNSLNPLVLRWTANVPVNGGYSAMLVKVVRP